jgi:hypothetical protein
MDERRSSSHEVPQQPTVILGQRETQGLLATRVILESQVIQARQGLVAILLRSVCPWRRCHHRHLPDVGSHAQRPQHVQQLALRQVPEILAQRAIQVLQAIPESWERLRLVPFRYPGRCPFSDACWPMFMIRAILARRAIRALQATLVMRAIPELLEILVQQEARDPTRQVALGL